MHNINELKIYQKALEFADIIYGVTEKFPEKEKYGITSQIKRSYVSIGSNIAEGAGRNSSKEFNQFLGIANGSLYELKFQIELSFRRKYIDSTALIKIADEIDQLVKMNAGLQNRLVKPQIRKEVQKSEIRTQM